MATTSSGGEWVVNIKPLLSVSHSQLSKHEIPDFTTAIIKCGDEILDHDEQFEPFYSSFVALSSHFLSSSAGNLPKSCFSQVIGACKVLLKFMLRRLNEPNDACTISPKYLMTLIRGLCVGTSSLPKSDIGTFTAMLKSSVAPLAIKETDMDSEEIEQKEVRRSRLDTGCNIFDQLTSVFHEVTFQNSPHKPIQGNSTTCVDSKLPDPMEDAKEIFAKKNLMSLTELEGSTMLLDVCQNLIFIARYTHRYRDTVAGTAFVMPNTLSEALTARNSYMSLLGEISIVWRVFSLPILEPLTPKRLDKIVSIVMSCLYTSMSVAMANSIVNMASTMPIKSSTSAKDEEIDSYGNSIVQKSLEIFDIVSSTVRNSTRAGGNMAQNLNVMAAWLLLRELQAVLALTPSVILERRDSGKSKPTDTTPKKDTPPSSRPGSGKSSFQGFEVLSVALANNTLQLVQKLLEDVAVEGMVGDVNPGSQVKTGLDLNILSPLTAWKRIRKLLSGTNLIDLLFGLVVTSFRKAILLQRVKQGSESSETSSSSTSDSNTFYEDDFSSSEDSSDDEDEDSEPILGQWLEETLSPSEPFDPIPPPPIPPRNENTSDGKRSRKLSNDDNPNFIPDRREPQSFVSLAANILNFINVYFINSTDPELQKMARLSLNEEHMSQLACVIKDLDRECTKATSYKVFEELSIALAKFSHSLISTNCLSEALQEVLLCQLGVSPNSEEPWPLTVHPRALAILAEVILLKQQREREAKCMKCQSEAAVVKIWGRFMDTLRSTIINFDNKTELFEDINVEHLQLLLFLFHSLPLMQKKFLLLQLAQNIISVSEADFSKVEETVPLPLSRLILVLDYLLHNFYDAPATLIEQVQWNLFTVHTVGQQAEGEITSKTSQFFPCSEVEESFWKSVTQAGLTDCAFAGMKPRFYNLASGEINNQDTPKVDGLACSFLLSNIDCLNYNFLYDSCISLLMAGSRCNQMKEKLSLLDLSTIHYHFLIVWRLLSCLPPSVNYLRLLESWTLQMGNGHILHTLRLAPRIGSKVFSGWIKDSLVKQGLTTQQAEALLSAANTTANNVNYDIRLAMNFIQDQIAVLPLVSQADVLPLTDLPSLANILMLDAVVAKVQVALDDTFTKAMADIDPHKAMDIAQDLIPATLLLLEAYSVYVRSCVLGHIKMPEDISLSKQKLKAFGTVMSISSSRASRVSVLGTGILGSLPAPIRTAVEKWNSDSSNEFPSVGAWRNAFASDIIPSEGYIDAIHSAHIGTLSSQASYTVSVSMRHALNALVRFAADLVTWCPDTNSSKEMVRVMFPLMFDITAEYLGDMLSMSLERFTGPSDGEEFTERVYQHVYCVCHQLIVEYSDVDSGLDEKIFHDCLKFMENHLEKPVGKKAFEKFYTQTADLTTLLLSVTRENLSSVFASKVLHFYNKLLQLGSKTPTDKTYKVLCTSLEKLSGLDTTVIQAWLGKLMDQEQSQETLNENHKLLLTFTKNIVKEKSPVGESMAQVMLSALLPMGENLLLAQENGTAGFPELMLVMHSLAGAGQGRSHFTLFQAATTWLEICKNQLIQQDVLQKIANNEAPGKNILETLCHLLSYIGEILGALKTTSDSVAVTAVDTDLPIVQEGDSDWAEEVPQEEEDSAGEDSDEESLNNKLCTFTITQKEFMNQYWYHCHTCKMVDGVGVCTVCAKVCHKDHDLTYAKFGSFFCDCGAKEDGSCKALVKRTSLSSMDHSDNMLSQSPFSMENVLPSSLRRRMSSPGQIEKAQDSKLMEQGNKDRELLCKQMECFREKLVSQMERCKTISTVVELLDRLLPTITENYQNISPMGSTQRAQKALDQLHTQPKNTETSDQLMTVTLGSQEGAFENVRINYSGDQGQQIRQLISAHMLRRVAMCVLASPYGKRQHLAVSHEKGKITILQLTALLKQADSSKKKLTLTRLSSAPIPFTVLSITGNPCNEDFLAVCGLKDCHVLTFNSSGSVSDHLVLHPTLATGNFIIKALWLPGSQTQIAIVTADFVKIYNLSFDALNPQYYFLLPSGKIRDASFVFSEEGRFIVLMASTGYIYTQVMDDTSSGKHGPFYITNVLEVTHTDLKDVNGQVAGGGVSIYYSHGLQLLFFSYTQGKSFVAAVSKDLNTTPTLFQITFKGNNGSSKLGTSSQPLVQWSEVEGHTGLMYCMTQSSNNPIVLMIRPDTIQVQEIKATSAKAKIQDVVAIRHTASNSDQKRTTMILLCEDGSLRIYMANQDNTNYWLSPYLQPQSPISVLKPVRQKKVTKTGRSVSSVNFPVDFFEHCQQSSDIEFGGNDILQVYNVQQVKHRLNTTGMYIASTKPSGFTMEIINTNGSTVMVGVRVLVGSQSLERAPSYLEVFGRVTQVNLMRARWFDLPFTREESLVACKKFSLFIGASVEAAGVTMVDSIKVYFKTKEAFGWPEETDDFPEPTPTKVSTSPVVTGTDSDTTPSAPLPLTSADRLLGSALEVLDGAFGTLSADDKDPTRQKTLDIATKLLTLPTPRNVQQNTRSLLLSLFPSAIAYHTHKDQAQLDYVMASLARETQAMDVEDFQRLLVTARAVAVSRAANLVKFAADKGAMTIEDVEEEEEKDEKPSDMTAALCGLSAKEGRHFISQLMDAFWKLHAAKPDNQLLAPVCLPGLSCVDATVGALVEIVHAFTVTDLENVTLASKLYVRLLLCTDPVVSFACKQALIRCLRPKHRRRRVFIPSPPRCSSPGGAGGEDDDDDDDDDENKRGNTRDGVEIPPPPSDQHDDQDPDMEQGGVEQYEVVDNEPMILVAQDQDNQSSGPISLEALLGGGNFPPIVDIPPDADDETMVELAIALSLQDQSGHGAPLNLQSLGLSRQNQVVGMNFQSASFEEGQMSDTTASAPGSDDEVGSNAATDGSTLRTSPAEPAGSAGSESGGSAIESLGDQNVSGRSSAYGDNRESGITGARSETSSLGMPSGLMPHEAYGEDDNNDYDANCRSHSLRLILLEKMLKYLSEMQNVGGVRSIPFMQVLLMLASDLDGEEEKDRAALDALLTTLMKELDLSGKDLDTISRRTSESEVKLVIMRLLSVLLSKTKAGTKPSTESSSFISNSTACALISSGAVNYCLNALKNLLPYWKRFSLSANEGSSLPGQLLKLHPTSPPPDMSPFFLRQYVKGHAIDIFEDYPQLLTEMVLRLPYQLKKISDSIPTVTNTDFRQNWHSVLAEYMMTQQTPFVKKQVRKLLQFICGSKDKYRQLRDMHAVDSHLQAVLKLCRDGGLGDGDIAPHSIILPYDTLLSLIEHLKVCVDIGTSRAVNWQLYCKNNEEVMPFLVRASIALDEGVASTFLQLLLCALCGTKALQTPAPGSAPSTGSPAKQKREKEKDRDRDRDRNDDSDDGQKHDEGLCIILVQMMVKVLDKNLLTMFIQTFLLESNNTNIRWQAHSLVHQLYMNSSLKQQEELLDLMWDLWCYLPLHGRKAAQFVDLLGYFVLKTPQSSEKKTKEYLEKAIGVLREENQVLANHPNAHIYNMLQGLVDFDGYYLENDPCLVCNNPEVPFSNLKLSAIKVDSKFTTSTQIVKLVGSHTISKISLRITDLKRAKMVRVLNIYYNNRTVQAVVELKNKPGMWHKARKVTLSASQTDVKVEFPVPIVACNLMIEYADFYDNLQASAETLQCPRCSASVPANPGVCNNCGENVFQCHKCRAINYDEKDPFLCNACGFCKYAKFDFTLTARPCCAVDPIENEDDRKKAIATINSLLEKADKIYKQLQLHRPALETLLIHVTEHSSDKPLDDSGGSTGSGVPGSSVNRAIQQLAHKYCLECKSAFDELSKIIQKVLACRRELVEYDRQQREVVAANSQTPISSPRDPVSTSTHAKEVSSCSKPRHDKDLSKSVTCYGCASSAVELCITLLRALVSNTNLRQILCSQGMIKELIDYNLRRGPLNARMEVRSLLCMLTKDNRRGTEEMNNLIMTRISAALRGHLSNPDLGSSVRHEIMLLATSLQQEDMCWEQRTKCIMHLFLMGMQMRQPVITESVTLPCLRILQQLMRCDVAVKKTKDKVTEAETHVCRMPAELHVNPKKWLAGDSKYSYQNWRKHLSRRDDSSQPTKKVDERKQIRAHYLMEKYATRWQQRMWKTPAIPMKLAQSTWLQQAMFSPSSRSARQTACSIMESLSHVPARKKEIIDMLTSCLDNIGRSGECAMEFLTLYKRVIAPVHWKHYLAVKGVLLHLGDLITKEVDHLEYLEETTLTSDLSQGYALRALTELLSLFVEHDNIKHHYKSKLVGYVLNGYLSLRKLVVQRTKLIDETQDKLLELLEDLTTGTDSETKEFMQVCVQTVKKYPLDDYRSPVFIFERLCSIIFPEENDIGEFFLILEKDPQQEDFLQGRMLGNPYSSSEPGLGPLMRDVKNKICQDCELVALLEDDTGMELLVNKKIISLDLPVKEVYKKVWAPDHGEGEPMPIIYRMRGLLGDATEDMVNSLDSNTEEDVDKEEVFKMASVLGECGGLQVMLERLSSIKDLVLGKQLMTVLLKLFDYAVNIKSNRALLIKPELNTITIMLGALNLALWAEQESGTNTTKGQTITEQILQIMEVILLEASSQSLEQYSEFSKLCGDKDQLMMLLGRINSPFVRANASVLQGLMRLIPFLAFGEEDKMLALINHFKPYLQFDKFDEEHTQDEKVHLDCFCVIASGIENNKNGDRLKDMIRERGLIQMAVDHILKHSPEIKTLLPTDSDNWKDFLSLPSISYVLRLLTGMCTGHRQTQLLIGVDTIRILHKLEQVSSDKHIGTMAENLLEALRQNSDVAAKIEDIRQQTKAEKKRLAMAVRKKHLGALGMTTNEKGQVTVKRSVLKQMEDLKEETGLTCCICREGYRYQPQKVLAVYTFTKRVNLDDYENKLRKSIGYSTVSHFNVIHVDCHTAAVRHARGREEWESAALQNANTKCNGLLPMWGPQVPESAFATCLARHNSYLQECTGLRDPSYPYTVHDIKLLLMRFAQEKSLSEESGGGGRQSNIHLLPYMSHMVLYVINTTRSAGREEKNLTNFLDMSKDKWVENCFETENVLYWSVMAVHLLPPEKWQKERLRLLDRLIALDHIRHIQAIGSKSLNDKAVKDYTTYKFAMVYFGLICGMYERIFKKATLGSDTSWSSALADYIRHNDKTMIEGCDRILSAFEEEMLPCESFSEVFDVLGILEDITEPEKHVEELLASIP